MAIATAFFSADMEGSLEWPGGTNITQATSTHLQLTNPDTASVVNCYGEGFTYSIFPPAVTGGTVQSVDLWRNDIQQYEISEGHYSAVTVQGYLVSKNPAGLMAYLFADDDTFHGSNQNDVFRAYTGHDQLNGNGGNDRLIGDAGNDRLNGGKGADRLLGGAGKDRLCGGAGKDLCTGGGGSDAFKFIRPSDGVDTLTDFVSGTDRIQVVSKNFGLDVGTLNADRFITDGTPTSTAAVFLYYTSTGTLWFDSNGRADGGVSPIAKLAGSKELVASDIQIVAA